jgi:hypothetical protein
VLPPNRSEGDQDDFLRPVLDDATAVLIYNALCDLVDRFDAHYGEQICRFYHTRDALTRPPSAQIPTPHSDLSLITPAKLKKSHALNRRRQKLVSRRRQACFWH